MKCWISYNWRLVIFLVCWLSSFLACCEAFGPNVPHTTASSYMLLQRQQQQGRRNAPHTGHSSRSHHGAKSVMRMIDPSISDMATTTAVLRAAGSLWIAQTEGWVQPATLVLDPFLNFMSLAMLARVVLSWYPDTKVTEFPWVAIVLPTEPLLRIVKGVIPPAFGVDITPVFWLAIFTFMHEIFLGQQGLLTMKIKYGI